MQFPPRWRECSELIMVTPTPGGETNHLVLAAAAICEVDRVFTIGGAQAIGALAYGTGTVPRVDKIVGPGNAYVAAAKRRVFGVVGIDMVAGPSEILVICDGKTDPDWIAMDLFSQAEHDELAQAILLSPDAAFIDAVAESIARQLETMPRKAVIRASLENRGALIQVHDLDEACAIANHIAPEHLELSVEQPEKWVEKITHAGAIFLGRYTSEALGDYCAGPNHVLPTSRTARFSSPLGVYDFQKRSSLIQVSEQGAAKLGAIASILAHGEGLQAHAMSAEYRFIHDIHVMDHSPQVSHGPGHTVAMPGINQKNSLECPDCPIRLSAPKFSRFPPITYRPHSGMVKLDAMENPYSLPPELRNEIARLAADAPINRYPDAKRNFAQSALREALGDPGRDGYHAGQWFGRDHPDHRFGLCKTRSNIDECRACICHVSYDCHFHAE